MAKTKKDWMISFSDFVEQEECTVLSKEQRDSVCDQIHRNGCAIAGSIAFSEGYRNYLVVRGGNLNYYAGLEYSDNLKVLDTGEFTVWEIEDTEDGSNATRIWEMAREAVKEGSKS